MSQRYSLPPQQEFVLWLRSELDALGQASAQSFVETLTILLLDTINSYGEVKARKAWAKALKAALQTGRVGKATVTVDTFDEVGGSLKWVVQQYFSLHPELKPETFLNECTDYIKDICENGLVPIDTGTLVSLIPQVLSQKSLKAALPVKNRERVLCRYMALMLRPSTETRTDMDRFLRWQFWLNADEVTKVQREAETLRRALNPMWSQPKETQTYKFIPESLRQRLARN